MAEHSMKWLFQTGWVVRFPVCLSAQAAGWVWRLAMSLALVGGLSGKAIAMDGSTGSGVASGDGALCLAAIQVAEREARLPAALLGSIGIAESGRTDPRTGRITPWPWSINVAGVDHVFETKAAAMAAVHAAWAAGVQSIDVGCMQVNLLHHPDAFASLDDAFDPRINAAYAAGFLGRLFTQTGGWPQATAAYHSQTPGLGAAYARHVMMIWPFANRFGGAIYLAAAASDAKPAVADPAVQADMKFDPYHVLTPEFRSHLIAIAVADRAALAARGVLPTKGYVSPLLQLVPHPHRGYSRIQMAALTHG